MAMSARDVRQRHGDFVVVPHSTWRLPNVVGLYMSNREKTLAMHAGHGETAIMLALAPDTVRMDEAVTNYPAEFPSKLLSPDDRPACAWTARDFGLSGIIGDPLPATAEQGHAIYLSDPCHLPTVSALACLHSLQSVAFKRKKNSPT